MYATSPEQVSSSTVLASILLFRMCHCDQFRPFFSRELYGLS